MNVTKYEVERRNMDYSERKKQIKRIRVSSAHQITIPQKFFEKLNITDEVYAEFTGDAIIIRPVQEEVDFSKEIIEDMIREDVPKAYFAEEFEKRKTAIRNSVHQIKKDAQETLDDIRKNGYKDLTDELFGDLNDGK
ncbi:hypothetical protein GCM10011409_25410 [Lentibacillus populi]|uniref:SpoVT-AbrB domain-containing protein n=1 Tax=Lentibacillus populi TaxID=1827502 RepID=A0A9W5TYE6_9BACI|nr:MULTISPECIES: AbrB/MazE/SpoVT family DNA-binding domain-containing protein [Bacillaceae]GGB46804.1 hypothetical protein GCM10011409_25410 [Lentibacillus populi]